MLNQAYQILLVEDDDDHAMLMEMQLARVDSIKGCDRVRDGVEAFAWLASHAKLPDLVLLDLNLPRLGGDRLLEIIRNSEATRDLPVIVITSSRQAMDPQQVGKLAVVDVLVKPVSAEQIAKAIAMIPTPRTESACAELKNEERAVD